MEQSGGGSDEDSDAIPIESDESISGDSDRERPVTRGPQRAQLRAQGASAAASASAAAAASGRPPDDDSDDPVECSSGDDMDVDEHHERRHPEAARKLLRSVPSAAQVTVGDLLWSLISPLPMEE